MAFLVLARSLREALYLSAFDVKTLPYITGTIAVLSIPTVAIFSGTLTRYSPKKVLVYLLAILASGLMVLWAMVALRLISSDIQNAAIVAFYLWTAIGTLLLTSGFWVVTSELFAVRGAKRLFGLIGAGGTAGAMVMGSLLIWLTRHFTPAGLQFWLVGLLLLFFVVLRFMPRLQVVTASGKEKHSIAQSAAAAWNSPHLRTIGMIIFVVGIATALLDYQFKALAQATLDTPERMTSFFGAFYGWTGAIALLLQLAVVARFLGWAGVGWTLAVLPLVLLLGSVGMLVLPSLLLVTALRGADATLRKSLYRSALEVLYVPVPSMLRRKTKTFIDSALDSLGEGIGAAVIFLLVTFLGISFGYLSFFIIGLSVGLLYLSQRMGRQYFNTVAEQLQLSHSDPDAAAAAANLDRRDLLSGTFTRLDIRALVDESGTLTPEGPETIHRADIEREARADTLMERLRSSDLATVARALEETVEWSEEYYPELARSLARDPLFDRAVLAFMVAGDAALMGGAEADDALLDALTANRFEVRYRAAIGLVRRRRRGLSRTEHDDEEVVWAAIRAEVGRGRPVWEMQKLLDEEPEDDALVSKRVGVRGELSLEHTFRLLSLVVEPEAVRAAFHGIILEEERLKSFALEYLEQVLPPDVRKHLWPFIGDVSEYQRDKSLRSMDEVVSDLMITGATLFSEAPDREALKQILEEQED
jgi:ATP/ADP translocase